MQKVIEQDSVLGSVRNNASRNISLSQTIRDYIQGINTIDMDECPASFRNAFQKHIQAWEKMISVADLYPQLRGEMHDLFNQLENEKDSMLFNQRLKAIWDTWAEVENTWKNQDHSN